MIHMADIEDLVYSGVSKQKYENEEIIFLYPDGDEIAIIEVVGDELKEEVLNLLDMQLPTDVNFSHEEVNNDLFHIKVYYK